MKLINLNNDESIETYSYSDIINFWESQKNISESFSLQIKYNCKKLHKLIFNSNISNLTELTFNCIGDTINFSIFLNFLKNNTKIEHLTLRYFFNLKYALTDNLVIIYKFKEYLNTNKNLISLNISNSLLTDVLLIYLFSECNLNLKKLNIAKSATTCNIAILNLLKSKFSTLEELSADFTEEELCYFLKPENILPNLTTLKLSMVNCNNDSYITSIANTMQDNNSKLYKFKFLKHYISDSQALILLKAMKKATDAGKPIILKICKKNEFMSCPPELNRKQIRGDIVAYIDALSRKNKQLINSNITENTRPKLTA